MKAVLFLIVLVLATQAQTPVHEFFHDFVSNLKVDASTKSRFLEDGLECINYALKAVAGSIQNIQYDIAQKDILSILKDALTGAELLQHEAFPRCQGAFIEIAAHAYNGDLRYVSREQAPLFYAHLVSIAAETLFNAPYERPEKTAKGLATLYNAAFGFEFVQLPQVPKFDYTTYVPLDHQKAIPAFFKGFFTTLGFNNLAQINATSQCIVDITNAVITLAQHPALQRGDELTMLKLNAILGGVMNATGAWERCKRLDTVDLSPFSRIFTGLKKYPYRNLLTILYNELTGLPYIVENKMNMHANMWVGQYEAAGQRYANIIKQEYQRILF